MSLSSDPVPPIVHITDATSRHLWEQTLARWQTRRAQAEAAGVNFDDLAVGRLAPSRPGRFSPTLHDLAHLLILNFDQTTFTLGLTPARWPALAPLIEFLKRALVFVVNLPHYILAHQQTAFNGYVARALSGLLAELETSPTEVEWQHRVTALEQRVQALEAQLAARSTTNDSTTDSG